jgi:YesN/AraC family two-component response regulator
MQSADLTNFKCNISTGGRGVVPRERTVTPRRNERGPTKARSRELEHDDQEETKSLQAQVATLKLELSSAQNAAGTREESKSELDLLKKQLSKCQSDLENAQKKKQPGLSPAQKGKTTKAQNALEKAQEKARKALEEAQQQVGQLTDRLSQQVALDLRYFPGPITYLHSFTRPSVAGNSDCSAGGSTRRK